ncbi:MAG: hypothetical protein CW694_06655 [Candidatus Syntrophoarchaeum sp. WYZ-LMO15]|nr:MAG: hypothetical protein CW694_06655 [Candidatus Syntrophoarchaeum sp. WYZ-LMO15]
MAHGRRKPILFLVAVLVSITAGAFLVMPPHDEGVDGSKNPTQKTTSDMGESTGSSGSSDVSGRIVSIDFDKPGYNAGDTINVELKFENTGVVPITQEEVIIRAYCERLDSTLGRLALRTMTEDQRTSTTRRTYSVNVNPGEIGTLAASFRTEREIEGVSLAGDYEVTVILKGNGITLEVRKLELRLN